MPDLKIYLSLYDDADANADAGECVALLTGVWLGAALILKLKIPPPVGHQTANLHPSTSQTPNTKPIGCHSDCKHGKEFYP